MNKEEFLHRISPYSIARTIEYMDEIYETNQGEKIIYECQNEILNKCSTKYEYMNILQYLNTYIDMGRYNDLITILEGIFEKDFIEPIMRNRDKVEAMLEAIADGEPLVIKNLSHGTSSYVFSVNEYIMKLGDSRRKYDLPYIDDIAPTTFRKSYNNKNDKGEDFRLIIEIQDKVETNTVNYEEVNAFCKKQLGKGLFLMDNIPDNFGRLLEDKKIQPYKDIEDIKERKIQLVEPLKKKGSIICLDLDQIYDLYNIEDIEELINIQRTSHFYRIPETYIEDIVQNICVTEEGYNLMCDNLDFIMDQYKGELLNDLVKVVIKDKKTNQDIYNKVKEEYLRRQDPLVAQEKKIDEDKVNISNTNNEER